ncbi:hypothetical protein THRCLA_06522 [Thraustotheca clavata]|uniref:CHAT domain-containing protein n=1 Tax=Thraustotheca clavata TaxID=74557 RepID=A0A1V9ZNS6_9STRA|nr:hypothetical protein THRCLA_06522 [Thraustotheca clavata]
MTDVNGTPLPPPKRMRVNENKPLVRTRLVRKPCTLRLELRPDCALSRSQMHALHSAGLGVIDVERDHCGFCMIGRHHLSSVFDQDTLRMLSRLMCCLYTEDTSTGYTQLKISDHSKRGIILNEIKLPKNSSLLHTLNAGDEVILLEYAERNVLAYRVGILFASPLVELDALANPTPLSELDYRLEYYTLRKAIDSVASSFSRTTASDAENEAIMSIPKPVQLHIRLATRESFRQWSSSLTVLHFTGHGNDQWFYVEDPNTGVAIPVSPQDVAAILPEKLSLRLVFLSSCASANIAKAFLSRGVAHVIATKAESELEDKAAIVFTRRFYTRLTSGRSVEESFNAAQSAVANLHSTANPAAVAEKFLLLPENGDHSTVIFPRIHTRTSFPEQDSQTTSFNYSASQTQDDPQIQVDADMESPIEDFVAVNQSQWSLHTENESPTNFVASSPPTSLMYETAVPRLTSGFGFRNIDMYRVKVLLHQHRIVTLTGIEGIGKTELAIAVAHYTDLRQKERHRVRVTFVQKHLESSEMTDDHCVRVIQSIQTALKTLVAVDEWPVLVVIDGCDIFRTNSFWLQRFEMCLSYLCYDNPTIKILLTAREPLPWSSPVVSKIDYPVGPLKVLSTNGPTVSSIGISSGYGLAALLSVLSFTAVTIFDFGQYQSTVMGCHAKSIVMDVVYQKSLRLSSFAKRSLSSGEITTLISIDSERMFQGFMMGAWVIAAPISLFAVFILLGFEMGYVVGICGGLTMFLMLYFGHLAAKSVGTARSQLLAAQSERVKFTNEILQGQNCGQKSFTGKELTKQEEC